MRSGRLLLALACSGFVDHAAAAMYRCPSGQIGRPPVVTNLLAEADARARACEPVAVRASPLDVVTAPPSRQATPAAVRPDAPRLTPVAHRVDPADQRVRDTQRRAILEAELRTEEEALGRARQSGGGEEVERRAARHQENVEALRRELGRLR
ncbi:hypothetical protein [Rhizobacter sp. LjRoot28]|jgi:hypothetical protein|uniref:hypothetical protein n=1 Tax=Rhizobacter sp. LjRoot28 TaxID=3342309 RepID=UPI003ECDB3B7